MKIPRVSNAMEAIDEDLIVAAEQWKKPNRWIKWGALAACLALVAVGVWALLGGNAAPGGQEDRYKDVHIQSGELAMVWPWAYQTVFEKYTELEIDGVVYRGSGRPVSETLVGESLGTYPVTGIDDLEGNRYTEDFAVYGLRYADARQVVAVNMEGTCYVFKKDRYEPPKTLGELFAQVDLPKAIALSRFSESESDACFTLTSDAYVWEVLSACEDAPFVEDDLWFAHDRKYDSFTVTSETLGVYKVAMYITEDGYLWTNAFDYQYLFYIGSDAAGKILQYAKEHSEKAIYEPYQKTVVGKVTEITDTYFLVDDSVLCTNPEEGIAYRILLKDQRISRYVQTGTLTVGELVQITYEGEIAEDNTIAGVFAAATVILSDKQVLIPE